jgi:biopolymer transport protein ExbD
MRRKAFVEINVVPFIDIVLVLLVIVLATASFIKQKSIKLDIPTASSKVALKEKSSTISIDLSGKYYFNKVEMSLKSLELELVKLNPKKDIVTLETDQKTEFQKFVSIVDILQKRGFKNLSIVTKTTTPK